MPEYFEIQEAYDGESLRLRLLGELDLASTPILKDRLARVRAEKRLVRLDLSGLEFIDSSGIHLLIAAFNVAREDGWQLETDSALSPQVHSLFKLTGLDRIVPGLRDEGPIARV